MIDKERWNIRTDRDKMGKSIKYNILVQYKKFILKKTSSSIKQSIHPMNDCFFFYELTHLDLIEKFTWVGKIDI